MRWKSEEPVRIEAVSHKRPDKGRLPQPRDDHGVIYRMFNICSLEGSLAPSSGLTAESS
jgi:hypothetical protein